MQETAIVLRFTYRATAAIECLVGDSSYGDDLQLSTRLVRDLAAWLEMSDSKLNATESPKLLATEKKSRDIMVLLLEQAKHQQQTVSRIRPWQNHSLAEAALCCCRLHGVRGDHRAGSWEAETRTYSCCGGTARSFY